ncbi:hypothetical protein GQ457_13G026400 [Hibiscus cannabinus]
MLANEERARQLDWNKRIQVVKGGVNALIYMHHQCFPPEFVETLRATMLSQIRSTKLGFRISACHDDGRIGKTIQIRAENTKLRSEFQEVKMIEEEKQWEGNDDVAASRFEKNVLNHDMKSGSDDEKPKTWEMHFALKF